MTEKKILVTQSSMPSLEEYIEEISPIWKTKWLTNMGDKHNHFKEELKKYLHVDNIELMVNGHMAIEMGLQVYGFPEGSEIITTPFTFASTTHAIVRNNLKPVFCDIDPVSYTIDPEKIEQLITKKTVAIMPVHVYGNICDVDSIQKIADRYGLKVLYDAAHTFGEEYQGTGIGNFGDMSFFSFHATKVFNSIEGGAVCFKDNALAQDLYDIKNFGIHSPEEVCFAGGNAKMNEFAAAMGLCNLRHVDEEIQKRKNVVTRYRENLSNIEGLQLNVLQEDVKSNYAYFPVLFDETLFGKTRNEVYDSLKRNGILSRKYFYPLTNTYDCYKWKYDANDTPVAKRISEQVLTLPLYADLSLQDVDRICDIIKEK